MTSNKIKSLEQADQSLSSQVATMKKQLLSLKSYANTVSPQKSTNNTDTTSQTGNKTASQQSSTINQATKNHTSGATNSESLFENIKRKQQQVISKTHETSDINERDKQEHGIQYIDDMISKNLTEIRESSKTTNQASGSAATPSSTTSAAIHNTSRETVDTHTERAPPSTSERSVDKTQTVDLTSPNPSQPQQHQSTFSGSRPTNPNSRDKSTDNQQRKQEAKTFKGVTRKNTTRYYIGHIDSSSTYSGLIEFLEEQELTPTMLHMFKTRNGEYAARVNIPSDQAEIMESRDIPWPDGVVVNEWMSKYQLKDNNALHTKTNLTNSNTTKMIFIIIQIMRNEIMTFYASTKTKIKTVASHISVELAEPQR